MSRNGEEDGGNINVAPEECFILFGLNSETKELAIINSTIEYTFMIVDDAPSPGHHFFHYQ
jgi:hypothetical protein